MLSATLNKEAAPTLTVASASSLGAARFNFTGVVPTGDKGGEVTGPEGLFLCVRSWLCLLSLLLCSILLFTGKLENRTRGELLEDEFGDSRKVSPMEPVWAGGLSRSCAPFSVFFTLMLVLVELPSNTMRGLFLNPSIALPLKAETRSLVKHHTGWQSNQQQGLVNTLWKIRLPGPKETASSALKDKIFISKKFHYRL